MTTFKTADTLCKEILTQFNDITFLAIDALNESLSTYDKFVMTMRVNSDYNTVSISDGSFTISMAKELAEDNKLTIQIFLKDHVFDTIADYVDEIIGDDCRHNKDFINVKIESVKVLCLELHELIKAKLS